MKKARTGASGRKVLVTGGTGSIGSTLVRQLLASGVGALRVFSRDESKQAALALELADPRVRYLIGDVRDRARLTRAFEGVEWVFHAAALKHVPACEYNPFEAVQTNVVGTQNVLEAAIDAGVERVVVISTDKAVNPLNTMGATKLLAERVVAASSQWMRTVRCAVVRFGNVLGSRGSVVPLWADAIARGQPVRLTDPAMTRFMMSIEEASRLVLEAAAQAEGGEIFILKMPALRMIDLAHVMIRQIAPRYGRDPGEVRVETGPEHTRPGEKLDEELLSPDELDRTEERKEMFIVYPEWHPDCARAGRKPIAPGAYRSVHSAYLTSDEILSLLGRSGALPAVPPGPGRARKAPRR